MRPRATAAALAVLVVLAGAVTLPDAEAWSPPGGAEGPGVRISSLPGERVPGPSIGTGTYTARILIRTPVRRGPGRGEVIWRATGTTRWSGTEQRLMVLTSRTVKGHEWLKVRLPMRPNGLSGWIPRDRVQLSHSRRFILIDLSRRRLSIYAPGRRLTRFRVVVGAPSTPTPRGLFAIYDRVRQSDPDGFTGPWVLPITAHSEQLRQFDGGPGVVGLHGRDGASLLDPLGSARSHGCIRMTNSRIRHLSRIMKGTAVRIRR